MRITPDGDRRDAFAVEVDGTPQSYVDLGDPANLVFEYVRRIGHVADLVAPAGRPITAVHLGGGGMTLPRYIAHTRPGSRQQVLENDRDLIAAVRRDLPFPRGAQIRVRCADARSAASVLPGGMLGAVELLVVDVFAGARTPAALTTVEFFTSLVPLLAPGAAVAVNSADGAGLPFARAMAATVARALGPVVVLAEPGVLKGRRFGNVVLVTGDVDQQQLARRVAGDPFPATALGGARFASGARVRTDADAGDSPAPPTGLFG